MGWLMELQTKEVTRCQQILVLSIMMFGPNDGILQDQEHNEMEN